MKFRDKKLLIFDLDGTLVDSAHDLAHAVNYMLETLNRKKISHDIVRSWVGNGAPTLVKRGLSGSHIIDENIDPELFSQALDIFLGFYAQNLCVDTVTYPNVISTLKALKSQDYLMAIVTNKPIDFVKPLLESLQLADFFEFSIGGECLAKRKPDPMPLLHVCERLNVSVSDSVMVGDSKNDILAANAAKMESIGVSYGYNYGEPISLYQPSNVVDDFTEILTLFGLPE